MIDRAAKRILDATLAAAGLVTAGPFLAAIGAAVKLDTPGPALFHHPRLGRGGRPIVVTKFRTMRVAAEQAFNPDGSRREVRAGDTRVTSVGRFLRGGLDELPQLVGVLRGELSLVGPRPDDLYAVDLYREGEWLKLSVKPGLTGLAAVSGRNDLPWRERLLYDIYYAHHRNIWLDLRIIAKTAALALGIAGPGGVVTRDEAASFAGSAEAVQAGRLIEAAVRAQLGTAPPSSPQP